MESEVRGPMRTGNRGGLWADGESNALHDRDDLLVAPTCCPRVDAAVFLQALRLEATLCPLGAGYSVVAHMKSTH